MTSAQFLVIFTVERRAGKEKKTGKSLRTTLGTRGFSRVRREFSVSAEAMKLSRFRLTKIKYRLFFDPWIMLPVF